MVWLPYMTPSKNQKNIGKKHHKTTNPVFGQAVLPLLFFRQKAPVLRRQRRHQALHALRHPRRGRANGAFQGGAELLKVEFHSRRSPTGCKLQKVYIEKPWKVKETACFVFRSSNDGFFWKKSGNGLQEAKEMQPKCKRQSFGHTATKASLNN